MAERELRIRAIADVAQAKAALSSLDNADVKRHAASTKANAEAKKQQADLLKVQLENAKATKAQADEVKKLAEAYRTAKNEAAAAAAEAKVYLTSARSIEKQEKREERQQARAGRLERVDQVMLKRLGVPESMLGGEKGVSAGLIVGGLSAAIIAAIGAGFKAVAEEQRAAQKAVADAGKPVAGTMDEIAKAGREMGIKDEELGKIMTLIRTLPGVASSGDLAKVALDQVKNGDAAGAVSAMLKTAQGERPIDDLMAADQNRRRSLREVERQSALSQVDAMNAATGEEVAKAVRTELNARGGNTVFGRGAAKAAEWVGVGEEGQLAAQQAGTGATLLAGKVALGLPGLLMGQPGASRFDPIHVKTDAPRPLGGD